VRQIKPFILILSAVGCLIATSGPAQATVIRGSSASSGNVNLEAFDITGGVATLSQQFLVPI
jgi:hypothetical protein